MEFEEGKTTKTIFAFCTPWGRISIMDDQLLIYEKYKNLISVEHRFYIHINKIWKGFIFPIWTDYLRGLLR